MTPAKNRDKLSGRGARPLAALANSPVAFDLISWPAAELIALGSLVDGFLGAHYGRRLSLNMLRAVIAVVGLIGLYRLLTL